MNNEGAKKADNAAEYEADRHLKSGKKKNFLIIYGLTLLVVALILLLFSYLSQIRLHREQLSDLEEDYSQYSVSAMASIEGLKSENEQLKQDNADYETELAALKDKLESLEQELEVVQTELSISRSEASRNGQVADALMFTYNIVQNVSSGGDIYMEAAAQIAVDNQDLLIHAKSAYGVVSLTAEMLKETLIPALETLEDRNYLVINRDADDRVLSIELGE